MGLFRRNTSKRKRDSRIPLLRDLTSRLSPKPGTVVYDCGSSDGVAVGLKDTKEIAIADLTMKAGGVFPKHCHDSIEFVILYSGEAVIETECGEIFLEVGKVTEMKPGAEHNLVAITDIGIIAIVVPKDEGFPDVT